jgi:transposase-like protein
MHRRRWEAHTTAKIGLQGLQGKPVAEICQEYQISQSLDDHWRDQFLAHASTTFESPQQARQETRLARANARLKTLVGEWLLELKQSDEGLG